MLNEDMDQVRIKQCIGCTNIVQQNFPISFHWDTMTFAIDTESCWRDEKQRLGEVRIKFCPVCRRDLTELVENMKELENAKLLPVSFSEGRC